MDPSHPCLRLYLTAAVRNTLDEDTFAAEAAKGRAMTVERAIAYGMENQQADEYN